MSPEDRAKLQSAIRKIQTARESAEETILRCILAEQPAADELQMAGLELAGFDAIESFFQKKVSATKQCH